MPYSQEPQGTLMTPEEALMTILRLIDGSEEVNERETAAGALEEHQDAG